jgi:hypothetical protein
MSSHLLLGSSAAFDPYAPVNLLSRARATRHGVNETSLVAQLSVTPYSASTTVLPFAIVNHVPAREFDMVLGKGWKDWTEANSGTCFSASLRIVS